MFIDNLLILFSKADYDCGNTYLQFLGPAYSLGLYNTSQLDLATNR